MPDTQSRFATMPPKQKAMAIVFFLIGIFILYEVIGMFRSSGSTAPIVPKDASPAVMSKGGPTTTPPSPSSPHMAQGPAAPNTPPPLAGGGPSHPSPLTSKPNVEDVSPPSLPYMVQQEQAQNNYLKALNDLQVLKLQREMAETNQAIMTAKLATVTAEKSISDLLSPEALTPKLPPQQIPASATSLAPGFSPFGGGGAAYVAQSVTMELDQWHAVLNYHGRYYEVMVGDVLPPDGSVVSAIDQKGVTLQQGGVEQRVPLTSMDEGPSSGGSGEHGPHSLPTSMPPLAQPPSN